MSILLTEFIPFLFCQKFLNIGIFVNIVVQRYQRACIIELCTSVTAINKIRILASCNQCADCLLCSLPCEPCLLYLHAGLFRNELLDLIVVVNL